MQEIYKNSNLIKFDLSKDWCDLENKAKVIKI